MKFRMKAPRLVGLVAASIALVAAIGGATAQEPVQLKGITVTAERMMTVEKSTGVVEKALTIKTLVNYSDLDVTTESGRKKLEARITEAASDACTELDKLLPNRTLEHGNCVREATERAMAGVK